MHLRLGVGRREAVHNRSGNAARSKGTTVPMDDERKLCRGRILAPGALLSGGERQRVSIARALLKDAPIVLLDEVTSALGPVNEAAVHEGIERLMAGRTVVMVAHRMRTVRRADRVVFLADGRIAEEGTHDELLRRGGRYADFWHIVLTPTATGWIADVPSAP